MSSNGGGISGTLPRLKWPSWNCANVFWSNSLTVILSSGVGLPCINLCCGGCGCDEPAALVKGDCWDPKLPLNDAELAGCVFPTD